MSAFPENDNAEEYVRKYHLEQLELPVDERTHNIPFFVELFNRQVRIHYGYIKCLRIVY